MFGWFSKNKQHSKPSSLGQRGELWAQDEYRRRGYKIIAANEFNHTGVRLGEIDFIARTKQDLAFVEVKTRSSQSGKFGSGAEAVNVFKQIKLLRAVKLYLLKNPELATLRPHIDVCEVLWNEVDKQFESVKILENSVEDWN
jgi:putative endonuclease